MPCFVTLSQKELQRLEAVQKIRGRRLTVTHAAKLLHLSRSQVHRLLQAYDRNGANGLASRERGQPSNRRHTDDFRNLALDLVRENYADFWVDARRRGAEGMASGVCQQGDVAQVDDRGRALEVTPRT